MSIWLTAVIALRIRWLRIEAIPIGVGAGRSYPRRNGTKWPLVTRVGIEPTTY